MHISSMGGTGMAEMLQHMQQKIQTNFKAADTDGDGKLSKTEFSAFDTAMKAGGPQGATGASASSGMPSADDMFSMLDGDGDGSVSLAEAETPPQPPISAGGMQALLQSQEATQGATSADGGLSDAVSSILDKIKDAFKAADKDGDGKLSSTEFADFKKSIESMAGVTDDTAGVASTDKLFSNIDTNGDGSISMDEVMQKLQRGGHSQTAAATTDTDTATSTTDSTTAVAAKGGHGGGGGGGGKVYDKLDTNKDGVVSAAELAAAATATSTDSASAGTTGSDASGGGDIISSLIQSMMDSYKQGAVGGALSALTSAIV